MRWLQIVCSLWAVALSAQEVALDLQEEFVAAAHPVLGISSYGAKQECAPKASACCEEKGPSYLQFGGSYTHLRLTPAGNSDYNGNLAGMQGLYEYRMAGRVYEGALLRWREGRVTGSIGSMNFVDWNAQLRVGYTAGNCHSLFSFFTGFGFRYLGQDLTPKTSPQVNFKYEEFYVPVGFAYDYRFASWFSWGLYGTWMPQVYPTVTIEPIGGARWILKKTIKNGIVEMPFTFFVERFETLSFIIKPFAEYWQDGKPTSALGLPRNTYLFVGVDANICFTF